MVVKKRSATSARLELVLTSLPGDPSLDARVAALDQAAARAGLRMDLALCSVDAPNPASGLRHIPAPAGFSSQAALLLAAAGSQAEHLLFVPDVNDADPDRLKALRAASRDFDWVFATRGPIPALSNLIQKSFLISNSVDFGAPCIVRRDSLAALSGILAAGDPLIALRLLRAAGSTGLSLGLLDAAAGRPSVLSSLGLDDRLLADRLSRRAEGLAFGAALVTVGLFLRRPALLSLLSFGTGILAMGYSFGKTE